MTRHKAWDHSSGHYLGDDAARMIAEAGMWRVLWKYAHRDDWTELLYRGNDFSALLAATLRVYATLPDAPATAAREEGERGV